MQKAVDWTAVLASLSVVLTAMGAGVTWLCRHVRKSALAQAELRAQQRAQLESQAELRKLAVRQAELEKELEYLRSSRKRGFMSRPRTRQKSWLQSRLLGVATRTYWRAGERQSC